MLNVAISPINKIGNSYYARLPMEWVKQHDLVNSERQLKMTIEGNTIIIKPSAVVNRRPV